MVMGSNVERAELQTRLLKAGLQLQEFVTARVSPADAWSKVARLDVVPVATYACERSSDFALLQKDWMDRSRSWGVIEEDGTFLISLGFEGMGRLPWARVKMLTSFDLSLLSGHDNEPEFLAVDREATRLCAVTTEEDGCWIVLLELTADGDGAV